MARPTCCRRIGVMPATETFGPLGAPEVPPGQVVITLDEFEAVRLADLEALYQEEAAERMGISRPTFSRIIATAHRKIAEALVTGKVLRIEGGAVRLERGAPPRCPQCGRERTDACECPRCGKDCEPEKGDTAFVGQPVGRCRRARRIGRDTT